MDTILPWSWRRSQECKVSHQKVKKCLELAFFERGKAQQKKKINKKGMSCLGELISVPIFKPEANRIVTERAQMRLRSHVRPWRANHRPDDPN